VKKYLLVVLPYVIFVTLLLFLQSPPSSFAFAPPPQKTVNETCTCYTPGQHDTQDSKGNQIDKNWYHCGPVESFGGHQAPSSEGDSKSYLAVGSCSNAEVACVPAPGKSIDPQQKPLPGAANYNFTGVDCPPPNATTPGAGGAVSCSCSNVDGNGKPSTETIGGVKKPTSIKCTDSVTGTTRIDSCNQNGGISYCSTGANLSYSGFANQTVAGIGCEQTCVCDGTNGKAGTHGPVGPNKNGYKCYDSSGTLGGETYCGNQEDYCQNNPNSTNGVTCVNSTKCTCNPAKTAINCTSKGAATDGTDETFTVDCSSSNKQCTTGPNINDPNFTAFNQPVHGIACEPLPSLPPNPSPPCAKWNKGVCTQFYSGVGTLDTGATGFVRTLFAALLSVSGGIALLLIIRAGYQLMTAQGKPEQLQQGRDQLIAAIVGLIFLVFSFVFLQLIGFDILHIPGFGQ